MKASIKRGNGFTGLSAYILHKSKGAEIVSSNMSSTTVKELAPEFGSIRAMRREVKNPAWHCSLALPPGETATPEEWDLIIRSYLKLMGIDVSKHQYFAAIHRDTDHQHVHIVVNRIGVDGNLWHGANDVRVAIEATQKLEKQYGLTITKGYDGGAEMMAVTKAEIAEGQRTGKISERLVMQAIIDAADKNNFKSFVQQLMKSGIRIIPSGKFGEPQGISYERDGKTFSGSRLGKKYAWKAIKESVKFNEKDIDLVGQLRSGDYHESVIKNIKSLDVIQIVDAVLSDTFSKQSFVANDVIEDMLVDVPASHLQNVRRLLNEHLISAGEGMVTTKGILANEKVMLENAHSLKALLHHDLNDSEIEAAITEKERTTSEKFGKPVALSEEQKNAIHWGLNSGLAIVQGSAGVGKTFIVEVFKLAYEAKGYEVIGVTVSKRAAVNLQDETGIKSGTVAKLIQDLAKGTVKINKKTVIVIDESGQLSTGQWAALTTYTRKAGAKIIATGEDKQLDAIQHGGSLRYFSREEHVGAARIETIVRQNEQWARNAVMALRDGRAAMAVDAMNEHDLIELVEGGRDEALNQLIKAWHSYERSHREKHSLIIAHKNDDVREIGRIVRKIRRQEGKVTGPDYALKCAHGDKTFTVEYANGDRVRLNKNNSELDLINGDTGTLLSISPIADGQDYELEIKLDRGGIRKIMMSEYSNEDGRLMMSSAYAMTIYNSQGCTINGDVFAYGTASMDRPNWYVACSRSKENTRIYCAKNEIADRNSLVKFASREVVKLLATENIERTEYERSLGIAGTRKTGSIEKPIGSRKDPRSAPGHKAGGIIGPPYRIDQSYATQEREIRPKPFGAQKNIRTANAVKQRTSISARPDRRGEIRSNPHHVPGGYSGRDTLAVADVRPDEDMKSIRKSGLEI